MHYKDGKNIFLTRYLTPTIFQKYHDNHIFLNVQNRYKNMTASKFHPIDAIKNRVSKNSAPSEHDTNTYTLTRLTLIINIHSIGNFSKQASLNELSINKIFHLIYFTLNFLYA